jgi:hypothetical protein
MAGASDQAYGRIDRMNRSSDSACPRQQDPEADPIRSAFGRLAWEEFRFGGRPAKSAGLNEPANGKWG